MVEDSSRYWKQSRVELRAAGFDPARAADNHGRGIAQANMVSFDRLTYNEVGNEVTCFVAAQTVFVW